MSRTSFSCDNPDSWTSFACDDPDFCVRSVSDDVSYGVRRSCLTRSEVFRDMFTCCDEGFDLTSDNDSDADQILDLHESSEILSLLLRLLHSPPVPPTPIPVDPEVKKFSTQIQAPQHIPGSVIPLPLLPTLFDVADKYALSEEIVGSLMAHFQAHASTHPLHVYGYATGRGWHDIAAKTSQYLLAPPVSSYTLQQIKIIPTVEAYHKLAVLQAFRVVQLRAVLLSEAIFPHGYGTCSYHGRETDSVWNLTKSELNPRIEATTDVAAEMARLKAAFLHCQTCHKACTAAIDMLAYKCRRIPRRIDKLPSTCWFSGI